MFERFTDRARKVLALANQTAQQYQHDYIDTAHILAGIIREGSGVGANTLRNLRALDAAEAELKRLLVAGESVFLGKNPQTPRAKKSIEHAIDVAKEIGDNYVGTEHLLLGLIREQNGVAAQVLSGVGVTFDMALCEVKAMRGHVAVGTPTIEVLRELLAKQEREVAETKTAIAVLERMEDTNAP